RSHHGVDERDRSGCDQRQLEGCDRLRVGDGRPEVVETAARRMPHERRERKEDDQAEIGGRETLRNRPPRASRDPGGGNRDSGSAQPVSFWILVTIPVFGSKNRLSTEAQPPRLLIVKSQGGTGNLKLLSVEVSTG